MNKKNDGKKKGKMSYSKFREEYYAITDSLYELLEKSGAPERVWIDDFDNFVENTMKQVSKFVHG